MTNRHTNKWPLLLLFGIVIFISLSATSQNKSTDQNAAQRLPPMAKEAHPAFEVATVKPSSLSNTGGNIFLGEHNIRLDNQSVMDLIAFAYSLHKEQIIGSPDWLDESRFDIQGQPDILGRPDYKQVQEMLQKLLTERFGLAFHFEEQVLPVFAVMTEKSGSKLLPSDSSSNLPSETGLPSAAGTRSRLFTNCTMSDFAVGMQHYVNRPVIDETGLQGRYSFTLTWTRDDASVAEPGSAPDLFTAVREQLGLHLEAKRGRIRVMQIDRISRPTQN